MVMRKIGLLIAVLVIAGAFFALYTARNTSGPSDDEMKNADMMRQEAKYEIESEMVAYFGDVEGLFARPKGEGPFPGVVVIHENRGLRPEIRDTAMNLAGQGYMVLAVDLLGGVAEDQTGARELTAKFNQETGVANMRAAAAFLREQGAQRIASLGWCFGGRQSLALATSGEQLDATIVYYGGGMPTTEQELSPIKWPVLGVFGDQDQAIPVERVNEFESSLNALGVENEVYIYPGVGHAFANPSGANYAPAETMDAWEKTLRFLEEHLAN